MELAQAHICQASENVSTGWRGVVTESQPVSMVLPPLLGPSGREAVTVTSSLRALGIANDQPRGWGAATDGPVRSWPRSASIHWAQSSHTGHYSECAQYLWPVSAHPVGPHTSRTACLQAACLYRGTASCGAGQAAWICARHWVLFGGRKFIVLNYNKSVTSEAETIWVVRFGVIRNNL